MKSHRILIQFCRWVDRNDRRVLTFFCIVFVLLLAGSFIIVPFTRLWDR